MNTRYFRHILYVLAGITATPFVLFLIAALLVYLPPIQRWAVGHATQYVKEATGMDVSIENLSLRFPIDLNLNGVKVYDEATGLDVSVGDVLCDVKALPLLNMCVEIDLFMLRNAHVNTATFVPDCKVTGTVKRFYISSADALISKDSICIGKADILSCDLDICLTDTAQQDTTTTETPWRIRLGDIHAEDARIRLHMFGDSLRLATRCNLSVKDTDLDLLAERYSVGKAIMTNSTLHYVSIPSTPQDVKAKGQEIDFNDLLLTNINLGVQSFFFHGDNLALKLNSLRMKEKSGLTVSDMHGDLSLDGTMIHLHDMLLKTPVSEISAQCDADIEDLANDKTGFFSLKADARLGRDDILIFAGSAMPRSIRRMMQREAMTLRLRINGDDNLCHIDTCTMDVHNIVRADVSGDVGSVMQPDSMTVKALFNLVAAHGGKLRGKASLAMAQERYSLSADAERINVKKYLPDLGIRLCGGRMGVVGRGFDIFDKTAKLSASVKMSQLEYAQWDLAGAYADMHLDNGRLRSSLSSSNAVIDGTLGLDALLSRKLFSSTFSADLKNIDFYALRMTEHPLSVGVCGHLDIETDMKKKASLVAHLSDIRLQDSVTVYHPDDIDIDAFTARDTTHAVMNCGDFVFRANARQGVTKLANLITVLSDEMSRQLHNQMIDATAYRSKLPDAQFYLSSGKENPVARLLARFGYEYNRLYTDLSLSPKTGINGSLRMDTLRMEGIQLDKIAMNIVSDADSLEYDVSVVNGPRNRHTFHADLTGKLLRNSTTIALRLDDKNDARAIDIAMHAAMTQEGIEIGFDERGQVMGYKVFVPNEGNYLRIGEAMRLSADITLLSDDETGLQLYTNDDNVEAKQDITLSVHNLDLAGIISVVPYMPDVAGTLSGDFHVEMGEENTTISSSLSAQNLSYEKSLIGNLSSEIVYMPQDDGTHYLDGILYKDDKEIANISGMYRFGVSDAIDARMSFSDFPLDIVNGFIPDKIMGFDGTASGSLDVKGLVANPSVNGELDFGGASVLSVPYGVRLAVDDDKIKIVDSKIVFEDYALYDSRKQPMTVKGYVDFSNLDKILLSMNIRGKNILLVDAKETKQSEAYGKAYVNFYSLIQGEVSSLNVKAYLEVLPSTNLYYILKDSPLTTDNRLKELVTFTDFREKQQAPVLLPSVDGITLSLTMAVKEGAHVVCWLNASHSNYVDIVGSGDLRFIYRNEEMTLNGRYTISQGEMKYSLPVIPLKTFSITPDSYVEFKGDIMNPRLNITATEKVKTSVTQDGVSRTVTFDCGVVLSKSLQDMGLQFIVSAPEDQTINDNLNTMSVDEKGKVAVTMLTTGLYLTDRSSSNITMNSALSSFLQNEINNIAGSALRTMDLSVGMESTTNVDGTMTTDYAFRFAKRFWNNRVSISVGGRIATGAKSTTRSQSFFDNVEMQYRLSDTSNQYLSLFYKKNVYDYLEGYLDQYGAGYMWKKKMQRLSEILSPVKLLSSPRRTPSTVKSHDGGLSSDTIRDKR